MSIIYGLFKKNTFKDDRTGYATFLVIPKIKVAHTDIFGQILCKGNIPYYKEDTPLKLEGDWNEDNAFVVTKTSIYSENPTVIANYIHNHCSGFGEKTSINIASTFQGDLFGLLDVPDGAQIIAENVKGVSVKKAEQLISELKNLTHQQTVFDYAGKYDISYTTLIKLDKFYGVNLETPLQSNAYKSGRILSLPFIDMDNIAFYYNMQAFDNLRIEGLIYEALKRKANEGHTIAYLEDIYEIVNDISLKESKYKIKIPKLLYYTNILNSQLFKFDDENPLMLSLMELDEAESIVASELKRLSINTKKFKYDKNLILSYEADNGITLEPEQKESLKSLKSSGIKIITGGPGTGKTTIVKALLHLFKNSYPDKTYTLCSPTGRAAQRMAETTGEEASTIHKAIDYKPFQNYCTSREHSNPIDADLIIVDEMSMVGVELFSMLLKAIKNGAIVILIGDVNQLPSVEAGAVLKDLIDSKQFETYKLKVCKRQAKDNSIIENAIKINNGETNLITASDFKIYRKKNAEDMSKSIQTFYNALFPQYDLLGLQVLSSTKKREAGTYSLNNNIQPMVNSSNVQFYYGKRAFKLHDKVMMLVNRTEYGYSNGDIGEIIEISDTTFQVSMNNTILTLDKGCAGDMILAYAVTAHKSQGSEYPMVLIAIPKYPKSLLKRKVIFTEITRAKETVIIFSEGDALEQAIMNDTDESRMTTLKEKIANIF